MQNQKKNRKSLVIGIIAAVVILVVLLAVLLTQCSGLGGNATEPVATTEAAGAVTYELYWNLDRDLYAGKSEAGMSSRQPEEDGLFHIRFQLDGQEVTLHTAERRMVNKIDSMDLMGLVFDEDGLIIDALDPEDMPLELVGYLFYVQSVGGKAIKLNSSDIFSGIEVMLERTENTGIWDMTGISGPVGSAADPIIYDRVIAVQNLDGELTHVFIVDRSNYFLTHEAECQHCEQTVTWYEWTKEGELPKRSGHYQLMNDVQLTAQYSMAENVKICLDLNGYGVHGATDDRVFSLAKSGTELALMDTSEAQTGKIAGHGATPQGGVLWVRNGNCYMYSGTLDGSDVIGTNGVTVMVDASHFFYFHGGTILGGTAQAQTLATTSTGWGYGAGGAVYIRGTMRMYGGTIKGGRATEGYYWKNGKQVAARGVGGNIFMNTGSVLEIQGGEILGGYAGNAGGNIYADGTAELIISGGTISGGSSNSKTTSGHGGNIYTGGKTVVTMSGGTICGGRTSANNAGGNVAIHGVMNMQGGSIFGGRASNGGNVHVGGNGKFNMYGGAVYNGYAEKYGGNINVSGTSVLTVYGGLIQNGTADSSGGNLNCNVNGTINIAGGTLSGGIAKGKVAGNGGGSISMITDGAKVNISGGVITGGSAEGEVKEDGSPTGGDGGNINMNRGTMTISGGVITAGKATGNAGGIYVGSNSKGLNLSGSALIYGNGTDIMRSAATAEGKSDIIVNGWKGNGDNGPLIIDRLKGVAGSVIAIPAEGKVLAQADLELFTSARKFLPLDINEKGQLVFADKVDLGQADHTHCLCGGTYVGHTCADTGFVSVNAADFETCWVLKDGAYHILGSMNLCLTEDIEISVAHFTAGYELNLCLNGHTVTVKDEGRLTSNGTTGVLNITDCTGKGTIKADTSRKGSLMTVYKGVLNIYGGIIDASAIKLGTMDTTKVGAAIYVRESADQLAMYGGKIIGGEAYRGGAVYVEKGSFKMYGGEITGGTASIGGNVATSLGSFEMLGGEITGGTATDNGAGVHIGNGASDTLILSGDARIYGNGTEDVYLGQQVSKKLNYLVLDNWNGNGEKPLALNCRGAVNGSVVAQAKEGALTADDLANLAYANSAYALKLKDGKVALRSKSDHEHCLCNGALTVTNGHTCDTVGFVSVKTAEEFKALFNKDNALLAPVDIVLTGDFALDAAYFAKGKVLNLCLNGHTITMTGDARLTASSNGELNITDCSGKGVIKAVEIKQSMLSTYSGNLNLYSGILDASAVDSAKLGGGAVILRNADDMFTMYGGQIIGGKVDRGGAVYVENGNFRMHGGTITGGQATIGGAVSVNKGTMEMTGGTITGCSATSTGGGVNIQANATSFTLSGDAKIYGNTVDGKPQDVYLGKKGMCLTMDNWAGNGENGALVLNCREVTAGSAVAQAKEGALTADDVGKLKYMSAAFELVLKDGKAILAVAQITTTDHVHCLCNGTLEAGCDHDSKVVFTEVSDANTLLALLAVETDTVNICLSDSFELTGTQKLQGKTVNLCLNGETLTMNGAKIAAQNGATLNITTCNGGEIKAANASSNQMLLAHDGGGYINLYNGIIDASAVSTTGNAAAVLVRNNTADTGTSTFTMYGGHIIGGKAGRGGAIYVEKGRFNMHGGQITDGEATLGGAVSVNQGVMEMTGGTITGCRATGTSATGGGVNIQNGAARFVISGTAKLYGNTCNDQPEDVYIGNKANTDYYLTMNQWQGNGENGALVLNHREPAVGRVVAQAKEGALAADDLAKLSYADSAYVLELKDGKVVLRSISDHEHCLCNGALTVTNGHTCDTVGFVSVKTAEEFKALFNKDNALLAPVDIVLTGDFALDAAYFAKGKVLNLCLNGHTITMTGDARLTASSNGELNITDCSGKGTIKAAAEIKQSMLSTYSGNLNLYSGILDASAVDSAKLGGGAVILRNADDVFTMYGGQIIGGKVDRGGAVYVENGNFRMHGGTITGGQATIGGAVSVNKGTMEMTGGTITGCSATSTGGGVNIQANATSFTLSGDAKIYGNTADGKPQDVYMGKKSLCLTLDNWAGNGENGALVLSCREATAGSAVAQAKEGALTADDLAKLIYADSAYVLELKDGKAVLALAQTPSADHVHCLCNGTLEAGCDHDSKVMFTEVSDANTLLALLAVETDTVNICLGDSFELTGTQKIQGKTVNLCLNGKTLTMNGAKLVAQNGTTLNITTCNGGKIEAGSESSNQMLLAHDGGGFINLYDGTIDASAVSTTSNAAAVLVRNNTADTGTSTFTMYGGTIHGGKAGRGGAVYVEKGRFNMHGGTITGGEATLGGAVSVNQGVMEMTGGTITGCSATSTGGGVNLQNGAARFVISGTAEIYGNTCNGQPEDVYIGNKANTAYYLIVNQWQGNGENGALVLNHREPAVDRVVAQAKDGALAAEDLAKLAYADSAYVLALNADGKAVLAEIPAAPVEHKHCLCNGTLTHTCGELVFTEIATADDFKALFDEDNKLKADSHIVLTGSFELEEQYFSNGHVWSLCLNGQTLTLKGQGRLTSNSSGELNITDCDGDGKLLAAEGCRESLITTNNGALNLYSGVINATAIDTTGYGGAVNLLKDGDVFTMYGGTIHGGKVDRGGAVYSISTAQFHMHGGSITGGRATLGGAVSMNKGTMEMTGGTITGCTATTTGGGVNIQANATSFTISGEAKIYDNTADGQPQDVYMGKAGTCLILDSWNGNGTEAALVLNCREAVAGSVVAKAKTGDLTADDLAKLKYADSAYVLELKEGKAVLTEAPTTHTHCLCVDGTLTIGCTDHSKLTFTEVSTADDLKALLTGTSSTVNVCLTTDIELTGKVEFSNKTVNLCLNGSTLNVKSGHIMPTADAILNITACNGGQIKGTNNDSAQIIIVKERCSVNLYNGTIDASDIEKASNGLAIKLSNDTSVLTMYGGTILGGKTTGNGGAIYCENKGKVAIHGGTITGGNATLGGAVSMNRGEMEMTGGTITGCTATTTGGGVNIQANATSFTISGEAKIYDNTADGQPQDVYMGKKDLPLTMDSWNGNGTEAALVLNCREAVAGSVVAKAKTGDLTAADVAKLKYADSAYVLELKEGKAVLTEAPTTHTHCLCVDGTLTIGCTDHSKLTFTEVSTADDLKALLTGTSSTVNVCLTTDIELTGKVEFSNKTVNLCLNGSTLNVKSGHIMPTADAILNITACNGGQIKGTNNDSAQIIIVKERCSVNLYNGTIDASDIEKASNGLAIKLSNDTSVLTMYGGTILGGKTTGNGGAIYCENKGKVAIHGGTITGGNATLGGAVSMNRGEMEMTGGTITGCTATTTGGGVNIQANATSFTISGDAKIYGNTVNGQAQDVYMGKKGLCLILNSWTGNGENGALVLSCREAIVDSAVAQAKDGTLAAEDLAKLAYADSAYVLALNADGKAVLAEIPAAPVEHKHCLCNGTLTHTCGELVFTEIATADDFKALFDEDNKLKADSHIVLTGSFELEEQYFSNGHIWSLCLNGQTLTLKGQGRLTANSSGELNITDCDGDGKLLAAEGCRESLITTNNGALNLYSGVINATAIDTAGYGGAVNLLKDGDVFTMYGGTIHGGKVDRGGAVYSISTAQFHMHGGSITGGRATLGGAVSMNKGTMEMTGGTITGCTATTTGGGVNIQANATSFTISGEAKIYDNTADGQPQDVYMGKAGTCLILDSWNGNGTEAALVLNCREAVAGSVVAKAKTGDLTADDLAKLKYADSAYVLELKEGKAVLTEAPTTHTHCLCVDGTLTIGCTDHSKLTFTEVSTADDLKALLTGTSSTVNVCLTTDIELTGKVEFSNKTVNLCLNGSTLNVKSGHIMPTADAILNITACNGGQIKGTNNDSAQIIIVKERCSVNLYNGTIDASDIEKASNGLAIKLSNDTSVLTMYGGTILGGKTTGNGGAIYCENKGKVAIHGGTITGGNATLGGAVSMNRGEMEMTGGTITGCTATTTGGGVNIQANATSFTISGDAKIYGNTVNGQPQDVYMGKKDLPLTMDSWNGNGTEAALVLNCREAVAGSVVAKAKTGDLTADDLAKLAYADSAYVLALNAEGKIALKTK